MTDGGVWGRYLAANEAATLRLILLTVCRPGEACGLPWSEIDPDAHTWLLPAERAEPMSDRPALMKPPAPATPRSIALTTRSVAFSGCGLARRLCFWCECAARARDRNCLSGDGGMDQAVLRQGPDHPPDFCRVGLLQGDQEVIRRGRPGKPTPLRGHF